MVNVPIALQLYTVRDETAKDFPGTVRKVAEMGYAGVEFAGTGGLDAAQMRDLLAETGLRPAGSHVGLAAMDEDLEGVIAYNQAIGNTFVGVPALPGDSRNPEGFRTVAAKLNEIGARFRDAGLRLYYHNHAFEFDTHGDVRGDVRGWDILLGETDPALVGIELDVYWAAFACEDPAELLRRYAGRFPLVHLKDMVGEGVERTWAEVGEGIIDFRPIFRDSEAQGVEWYIVEQDRCQRPTLEAAKLSLDNLKRWNKA